MGTVTSRDKHKNSEDHARAQELVNAPNAIHAQSSRSKLQKSKGNDRGKLQRRSSNACSLIVFPSSISLDLSQSLSAQLFEPLAPFVWFQSFLQGGQPRPTNKALAQHARTQAGMHETSPRPSRARGTAGEHVRKCNALLRHCQPVKLDTQHVEQKRP